MTRPVPLILVVEDDPSALRMVTDLVGTGGGARVVTAQSLSEAKTAAEMHRPALVLADRFLHEEDGLDLCRWIKAHPLLRDTMFVLVTGADETRQKIHGFDAGADDYITKPFDPEELLSRIRVQLRIRTMQDQLRHDHEELARLNRALGANLDAVRTLLVNIIGLRVRNASQRSERGAALARWMAQRLEMDPVETHDLVFAAQLHEIGKVIMHDEVLARNPADRTAEDRATMQQFPIFGQMIVGNIPELMQVGLILRHQMEEYDGRGYPGKLRGEEIPRGSRILRVINLLGDESVAGSSRDAVVQHVRDASGHALDPALVRLAEEYLVTVEDLSWMEGKREVELQEIAEGMVIVSDLYTSSGLKLLNAGSRLTRTHIERIHSHNIADPIINKIYIFT